MKRALKNAIAHPLYLVGPLALGLTLGCISPPPPNEPLEEVQEVTAGENEAIRIHQAVILFDASGSMETRSNRFVSAQNLASSFVTGMPEGEYETAVVVFGGDAPEVVDFAPFDRDEVDSAVIDGELLGKSSDIPAVLDRVEAMLAGRSGTTAIVVFSDGVAARHGRNLSAQSSLSAARQLVARADGDTCFYTIQTGDDAEGTVLMQRLAGLTSCGEYRRDVDLADEQSLHDLQQLVFIEESLPAVSAQAVPVFVDTDNDGVEDGADQCPGTPQMAHVNRIGCWALDSYTFDIKKYDILESQYPALDGVAEVLKMNPALRIRIDGHTDSTGTADFNQTLSERRANAVRDYLQSVGIEVDRLETRGFGMSSPIARNDTDEGMAVNRRCQLTVLE